MKNSGSQLKKGILLNYLNLALSSLIPLFYTPIMLSILGQNEYGLYKLSGSVTSYLSLMSLGLGSAITRYLIKARTEKGVEEEQQVLGIFIIIFRVIALLTIIMGGLLSFNIDIWYSDSLSVQELSKMKILIFVLACNTAVSFLTAPYLSIVNSHERFVFLQSLNICSTFAIPLINLLALFMGYASIGLAVSSLFITVVYRLIYHFYVTYNMKMSPVFVRPSNNLLKDILTFSFWIFVSNIVGQLYGATDMVMIGYIPTLATIGVAIYSIGETFTGIISSMNAGISSLLIPRANIMVFGNASNDELTDMAIKTARIQCYILSLIIAGFISFGRPFIHFYVGDEYAESYWVSVLCILPTAIPLLQSFCLNILIARNKNKFRALVYLFIAILNVIGTWFLLQKWGVVGAAAMTSFSMFLGHGIIMNWFYKVKLGLDIYRFWMSLKNIILVSVLLCCFTLVLGTVVNFYHLINLLIGIVTFTLCFILVNWFILMNETEKNIIKNILHIK